MKKILVSLFIVCFLIGCEDIIDLDLPERDFRVVVDGLITNDSASYTIKLTKTSKYTFEYDTAQGNFETEALVIVSDNIGNIDTLEEGNPGIYKTHTSNIVGVIGRSYRIDIFTQDGKHYQSKEEKMLDIPKIDSIYFDRDTSIKSPDNPDYYLYDIYVDWQDQADISNYYLRNVSYYWSNQWHDNIQWNWVFSDKYFDGQLLQKQLVQEEYGGYRWYFKLNQYSLSKDAYDFWILVQQQTAQSDAYSNAAVPLIGNVFNVEDHDDFALGYFQVSAKTSAVVYIDH